MVPMTPATKRVLAKLEAAAPVNGSTVEFGAGAPVGATAPPVRDSTTAVSVVAGGATGASVETGATGATGAALVSTGATGLSDAGGGATVPVAAAGQVGQTVRVAVMGAGPHSVQTATVVVKPVGRAVREAAAAELGQVSVIVYVRDSRPVGQNVT